MRVFTSTPPEKHPELSTATSVSISTENREVIHIL